MPDQYHSRLAEPRQEPLCHESADASFYAYEHLQRTIAVVVRDTRVFALRKKRFLDALTIKGTVSPSCGSLADDRLSLAIR